jgi:hypothetical protein
MNLTSAVLGAPHSAFGESIDWTRTMLVLIGGVLLVAGGAGAGYLLKRRATPTLPADPPAPEEHPAPPPPTVPLSSPDSADQEAAGQRGALIAGCLELRDILDDLVSIRMLDKALAAGGVQRFDETGTKIDSTRHRVTGTVAASTADDDRVIARTSTEGYLDAGAVIRPAEVVIFKWARP